MIAFGEISVLQSYDGGLKFICFRLLEAYFELACAATSAMSNCPESAGTKNLRRELLDFVVGPWDLYPGQMEMPPVKFPLFLFGWVWG